MREANFMLIEMGPADSPDHNAIVTREEAATHFAGTPFRIVGFMFDDEAEALTLTERGLAHLDGE